jgi:CheY-like chemotaxis protein
LHAEVPPSPDTEIPRRVPHPDFTNRERAVYQSESARAALQAESDIAVLLVSAVEEDHVLLQRILTKGFTLTSARTAAEAAAMLPSAQAQVVLADCGAGENCWKQVRRAIAHGGQRPRPRLIVISEGENEELWDRAMNAGAADVVARPFDPDEVLGAVVEAWHGWSRERELRGERRGAGRTSARGTP